MKEGRDIHSFSRTGTISITAFATYITLPEDMGSLCVTNMENIYHVTVAWWVWTNKEEKEKSYKKLQYGGRAFSTYSGMVCSVIIQRKYSCC